MPKTVYSVLYQEYLVIYTNPVTNKTTIEHCGADKNNAKIFKDSLVLSIPMLYSD